MRRSILVRIFTDLEYIRRRLDDLEREILGWRPQPVEITESDLLRLPDHLRKTYLVVAEKRECDANAVSCKTGRCRAVESSYLNQLVHMGWLASRKDSRYVVFRLTSKKGIAREVPAREVADGS